MEDFRLMGGVYNFCQKEQIDFRRSEKACYCFYSKKYPSDVLQNRGGELQPERMAFSANFSLRTANSRTRSVCICQKNYLSSFTILQSSNVCFQYSLSKLQISSVIVGPASSYKIASLTVEIPVENHSVSLRRE